MLISDITSLVFIALINSSIIYWSLFNFALNGLIIYFWSDLHSKIELKSYRAIQRIHCNETPRLGGFTLILSLTGFVMSPNLYENYAILKTILISLIPVLFFGMKEDLFYNVSPAIRIISLIFVGLLFMINFTGPLPDLTEIYFVGKFFSLNSIAAILYILGIVTVANGMNLIDGINGLCIGSVLSILGALLFLSAKTNDIAMFSVVSSLIILSVPFVFFNFPFGKIFLGDLGAYSLGLILSMFTIILFGRHHEISPYNAILILIYPLVEVLFSLLRRIKSGAYFFEPDKRHLHFGLFYFLRTYNFTKKIANPLVAPILSILWAFPLIAIPLVYHNEIFILLSVLIFLSLYLAIYFWLFNTKKS